VQDYELIAQEVNALGPRIHELEERLAALAESVADVQKVNARLEAAALTTARSLQQIATHWDAVYEAMRREEVREEVGRAEDPSDSVNPGA
jgi:predicted  nucleic acid-binding Zn-ribbon protein